MLHEEAFDVLGLDVGANATEIKQAYRDLVKVWHPDRFGSDPLLRQKAEEKLQQINIAHEVLQSPPKEDYSYTPRETLRRYADPPAILTNNRPRWSTAMTVWIGGGLGIVLAIVVAILGNALSLRRTEAPVIREVQTPKSADVGDRVEPTSRKELKAPKDASRSNQSASGAQFRVRPLSDVETARLESACPVERKVQDPVGYQDCVRAQLGASAADMSALSADDRVGIESACKTKIQKGSAAYNRCLTRMVKSLDESTRRRAVE